MKFLNSIDVSASGLTAQRLRMDTIASNIANAETTRVTGGNGPYRRQVVVMETQQPKASTPFDSVLQSKMNGLTGVRVKEIRELSENEAPFRKVYDPSSPDADQDGYVNYPNVNVVEEMVNMIASTRAFEANAKVIESTRSMALRALEIGR